MEIKVVNTDIKGFEAGAIIVNIFERNEKPEGDAAALDQALDGAITRLISQGEIKGKINQVTVIYSLGKVPAERVVVAGLGKQDELSLDKLRGAMANACRLLRGKNVENIATVVQGAGVNGITMGDSAQALTEGALQGTYTFRRHKTKEAEHGVFFHQS